MRQREQVCERQGKWMLSAQFHNPSESRHQVERSRTLRTNQKRVGDEAVNRSAERGGAKQSPASSPTAMIRIESVNRRRGGDPNKSAETLHPPSRPSGGDHSIKRGAKRP